jgi:hypothetical protein
MSGGSVMAWHFVGDRLRDGRPVPKDGGWLTHKGPVVMCGSGLHASVHPFDALTYAPGAVLCRVECEGDVVLGDDKLVCRRRRIVARMDATELLRYFARMQALSVIHLWTTDPPDVVLDYLMTGDETIRAAVRAAAWDAARDAARDAVRAAAWDAARDAAWDAARAAVRAAARAAVRAAAWDAAWAAARDAARDAVRAAAWDAARADFASLVAECFGGEGA